MAFEGDIQNFAPAEVDDVGAIILKARDLIGHPLYWCQGRFNYGNRYCILGAFGQRADNGVECPIEVKRRIARALPAHTPYKQMNPERAIMRFNDAPSTTHADILALLDRAALSSAVPSHGEER
jgi:hypothetical protein